MNHDIMTRRKRDGLAALAAIIGLAVWIWAANESVEFMADRAVRQLNRLFLAASASTIGFGLAFFLVRRHAGFLAWAALLMNGLFVLLSISVMAS